MDYNAASHRAVNPTPVAPAEAAAIATRPVSVNIHRPATEYVGLHVAQSTAEWAAAMAAVSAARRPEQSADHHTAVWTAPKTACRAVLRAGLWAAP